MAQQYVTYGSYNNEYGQEYVYPSERMYVHSSVYLPSSEIDPRTGLLKPDQPRRGRTQAKKQEYIRLDQEYQKMDEILRRRMEKPGRRMPLRTAIMLVAVVAFVFGLLLLSQQGTLAEKQKDLNRVNKSIEACAKENDLLAVQITEASDASVICYAAVRDLQMIPGESAEAIHLVAMDTRPMESGFASGQTADAGNAADAPGQPSSAEATKIPAVASAGTGP